MLEKMDFLIAAENKESFFLRVSRFLPTLDPRHIAIRRAYEYAKDAFRGRTREAGERYFEHLRAVALILMVYLRVTDYEVIIAAILHDIVEDIPFWTVERIRMEFGDRVALLVEYLTKPPEKDFPSGEERDKIYHERFAFAPRDFFLIKLADRLHNLIKLWACSEEKQERKIAETQRYYLPYAEKHLILLYELEEALEVLEEGKKLIVSGRPEAAEKKA